MDAVHSNRVDFLWYMAWEMVVWKNYHESGISNRVCATFGYFGGRVNQEGRMSAAIYFVHAVPKHGWHVSYMDISGVGPIRNGDVGCLLAPSLSTPLRLNKNTGYTLFCRFQKILSEPDHVLCSCNVRYRLTESNTITNFPTCLPVVYRSFSSYCYLPIWAPRKLK